MLGNAFRHIVGSKNVRSLKRMNRVVNRVNEVAADIADLPTEDFPGRTNALKKRFAEGESLEKLLPEAFALVRESADRSINLRHYDVQLVGGIALHEGHIAEMRTGEGKTLVATLAAYLNALTGLGVHIVTVNDYLARRDAEWMGPVYETLGLTVGVIQHEQDQESKRQAYKADITYGTNHEFGFDYLRDNMAFRKGNRVQRGLHYAIVDEVDSILIDEARTPLIISGHGDEAVDIYRKIDKLARGLVQQEMVENTIAEKFGGEVVEDTGDFFIDEKNRSAELTELGHHRLEEQLIKIKLLQPDDSLYAAGNIGLLHHIQNALRANHLYKRDVEYMVQDGQVVIIDEHTGRAMTGRRWSDGLHQAVEAKEGLAIRQEMQTMASTTYQNYFRLYSKLAGMTGTADTEAFEFQQIYRLSVVVIPTHMEMIREDRNDLVFRSMDEKYDAIVADINDCIEHGRPVLVGTTSIESSERISQALRKHKIKHNVLNAKQHEREAQVVAEAGRPGTVTIATNMAGRGTDIVLGGNWQAEVQSLGEETDVHVLEDAENAWKDRHSAVVAAGGLHIIGTERHESRRIDNQLRGRAGRQGDPGSSRFYLSMEDNLMRIFVTDRVRGMINSMGLEDGEAIEHRMVNNSIERAQRKVEGRNFDVRKNLLEYDDVANDQRQIIYQQRNEIMDSDDVRETIDSIVDSIAHHVVETHLPPEAIPDQWDIPQLERVLASDFNLKLPLQEWLDADESLHAVGLADRIADEARQAYEQKAAGWSEESIDTSSLEREILLSVLDTKWKDHLQAMEHLRQGIHLRAYAQKQPKQEYKRESFELFQDMLFNIQFDTACYLLRVEIRQQSPEAVEAERRRREEQARRMQYLHSESAARDGDGAEVQQKPATYRRETPKVGRNEPCPCGSGRKYKHCHGKAA